MDDFTDSFESALRGLAPASADPSQAVAAAYEAGRRDGGASSASSLTRWRLAAGVLLSATIGLSVAHLTPGKPTPSQATKVAVEPAPTPAIPVAPGPYVAAIEAGPPRPESYVALRSAILGGEGQVDLDRLPTSTSRFGGPPSDRVIPRAGSLF